MGALSFFCCFYTSSCFVIKVSDFYKKNILKYMYLEVHTLERDEKRFFCNSEFHGFNRSSDSNLTTIFRR